MSAGTLYERLGGAFRIAEMVNHFSDRLIENPVVGQTSKNPRLQAWHTQSLDRWLAACTTCTSAPRDAGVVLVPYTSSSTANQISISCGLPVRRPFGVK